MLIEALVSFLLVTGAAFVLIGSIGLVRMPDVLTRLHGPTKATTLGVGALIVAAIVEAGAMRGVWSLRELTISIFLFLTAPVSAHVIGKAALKLQGRDGARRNGDEGLHS